MTHTSQPSHNDPLNNCYANQLGQFLIDHVNLLQNGIQTISNYIYAKYETLPKDSTIVWIVNIIYPYVTKIFIACKYSCTLVCFFQSKIVFLLGTSFGIMTSIASFPINLPSLRQGQLFSEKGSCITLFALGIAAWYTKTQFLVNALWASLAGTFAGNMIHTDLYQRLKWYWLSEKLLVLTEKACILFNETTGWNVAFDAIKLPSKQKSTITSTPER